MKDYATLPNISGAFPNVVGLNATGPGETDGTPYIKQVVDDMFGARQALMDKAELSPNGNDESVSDSQFLDALETIIKLDPVRIKNWTLMPFATTADGFTAAAFVGDISGVTKRRWVAVGEKNADSGIWSSRGALSEWTERVNPAAGAFLQAIIWDTINDLFVAVGNDDGGDADILTSPDGKTWTERANPKAFDLFGVASDGLAIIVAVGAADGSDAYIVTSPDGLAPWTEQTNPKNFNLLSVAYSPTLDLFCAVGAADGSDAYIVTSPDGVTWLERANPSNFQLNSVAWGGGKFVAVGVQNGVDSPYIIESSDGITWNAVTIPEIGDLDAEAITYSDDLNLFIAITFADLEDDSGPAVFFSPDGVSWTVVYLPIESISPNGIHAGAGGVVIVGDTGKIINSQQW